MITEKSLQCHIHTNANKPSHQKRVIPPPPDYAWIWVNIGFVERKMRHLSFLFFSPSNPFSSSFLPSCVYVYVCFSLFSVFSFSLPFFCSHFLPLITETSLLGFLVFNSSGNEERKKGGEGRGRKAPLSVPLLVLHGTGRTKAFPDRPDRFYLCPANMSSACVFAAEPCSLFTSCHGPPPRRLRTT